MQYSFEEEYKKHEKSLFFVAVGILHNTEDAKDTLQEAAFSAYKSYEKLHCKEYFKTWITRIVINKCKDFLRNRKFTEELTDNLNVFCNVPTQEMEIVDVVCRLNPDSAKYITLRFYNDMTYDEVAKTLHKPVSTVKYRTKKALEEMKQMLEGDTHDEYK